MFIPSHRDNDLPDAALRFARVPRYGRLLAMLDPIRSREIRTEADVFWLAYSEVEETEDPKNQTGLIHDVLRLEDGHDFGWHDDTRKRPTNKGFLHWQIRWVMAILGATAYEIMFGDAESLPSEQIPPSLPVDSNLSMLPKPIQRLLKANANRTRSDDEIKGEYVHDDWENMQKLGAGGLNHFVFAATTNRARCSEIRFNDIS
ncbi:MAG: hypothetical protein ABL921_35975, partial [Pirellula sp.]